MTGQNLNRTYVLVQFSIVSGTRKAASHVRINIEHIIKYVYTNLMGFNFKSLKISIKKHFRFSFGLFIKMLGYASSSVFGVMKRSFIHYYHMRF